MKFVDIIHFTLYSVLCNITYSLDQPGWHFDRLESILIRLPLFNEDLQSTTSAKAIISSFALCCPDMALVSVAIARYPEVIRDLLTEHLGAARIVSRKPNKMVQNVMDE